MLDMIYIYIHMIYTLYIYKDRLIDSCIDIQCCTFIP